jgi:hypothetical protein
MTNNEAGHPYAEHEGSPLWRVLESEILALEENRDLKLTTARPYVVGSLASTLIKDGIVSPRLGRAMPSDENGLYQCAFCVGRINESPVLLTLNFDDEGTQELYSHATCFRQRLHPSVPLAF